MTTSNSKNVRGKSRGVNIDRPIEANPITLKASDEKQTGKYSDKLSNEIGLIVKQHAPVRVEKWKQVPQFEINAMLDRVKVKFLFLWV